MYKRDYILTLIEELGQFLARLLFLKETRRFEVAIAEVEEFCIRVFGRTAESLVATPHEELIALCTDDGELNVVTSVALASMMKELGDIAAMGGMEDEPCRYYTRSLALFLETYGDGTRPLPVEVPERVEIAVEKCMSCELPESVKRQLFRFLELRGFYADAEDLLFELVDAGASDVAAEGIAFYDRLIVKSDEDLANGDLPRAEVEEGRETLRRLTIEKADNEIQRNYEF